MKNFVAIWHQTPSSYLTFFFSLKFHATQLQTDCKQNNKALSQTFLVFSHTTLDFSFPLSSVYLGGKALEIFREKKKKSFFIAPLTSIDILHQNLKQICKQVACLRSSHLKSTFPRTNFPSFP